MDMIRKYIYDNIVPDKVCKRCGNVVLKSEVKDYQYQCVFCDEDLFSFEVEDNPNKEISQEQYRELVENTYNEFFSNIDLENFRGERR